MSSEPWNRHERTIVTSLAIVLVLLRSVVPTMYEGFFFDSDQAIVGLMAKHLSALHAFPLYYYGQNYLLGVQAWIIAPFFALFRPTVAVMRVPLILLNLLVAMWLMRELATRLSLRPATAFLATLPFIAAGPAAATHLLWAGGASIEPFVYVLALWALRRRPIAFGIVLAVGFQHREWTIFALPALIVAEAASGELWSIASVRRAGWALLGFGAAWLVLDDLKMHLTGASAATQAASLVGGICVDDQWRNRVAALLEQVLPPLYNGTRTRPFSLFMNTTVATGHPVIGWLLVATAAMMVGRIPWTWPRRTLATNAGVAFPVYLTIVGVLSLSAYTLSCTIVYGGMPLLRYVLFGLFVPIGLCALFMRLERSLTLRRIAAGVFLAWAALNTIDNVRVIAAAIDTPPPDEHRVLTEYLLANQIHYARAKYWDAYVVDFLSREKVIVASYDTFRIPEYQQIVDAHADAAVTIVRQPCQGFATVASWCLQR